MWSLHSHRVWVLAPQEAVKETDGILMLTDPGSVMRIPTTHGSGIPTFTDQDLAERYIRDGQVVDYEVAKIDHWFHFVRFVVLNRQTVDASCFVVDPMFGAQHARIYTFENAALDIQRIIDQKGDGNPGQ